MIAIQQFISRRFLNPFGIKPREDRGQFRLFHQFCGLFQREPPTFPHIGFRVSAFKAFYLDREYGNDAWHLFAFHQTFVIAKYSQAVGPGLALDAGFFPSLGCCRFRRGWRSDRTATCTPAVFRLARSIVTTSARFSYWASRRWPTRRPTTSPLARQHRFPSPAA